ncbi:uncharacterized protein LOC120358697 [Solenopsis invicta]|uniref:uncharacterized protein LOC120358697 n=1 Tax=Solenopsis invicta TaxID=13686 RepID=UPI00193E2F68|nr:uncharacterized protein LOC120358697 [Solenopsis invicta]
MTPEKTEAVFFHDGSAGVPPQASILVDDTRVQVEKGRGGFSFHMTQVLTGHACFGEHLHERTGREATTRCHHCPKPKDTAQHTLEFCPAWADERRALVAVVRGDLSLPTVVERILESPEKWDALASFCSNVIAAEKGG